MSSNTRNPAAPASQLPQLVLDAIPHLDGVDHDILSRAREINAALAEAARLSARALDAALVATRHRDALLTQIAHHWAPAEIADAMHAYGIARSARMPNHHIS